MKLFVGSLPFNTTENDLLELFRLYGEVVSVKLVTDHFSGESKGFAFVEMSTRGEGHKAMEDVNGKEYKFRKLVCREAKPAKKKKSYRR